MQILLLIKLVLTLVSLLTLIRRYDAADWDCPGTEQDLPATAGTFDVPEDCQLTTAVLVVENLALTGTKSGGALSVITAADSSRHFNNNAGTLTLTKLKLKDRMPIFVGMTYTDAFEYPLGGSIFMYGGYALSINNCVFESNRASVGGAIFYYAGNDEGKPSYCENSDYTTQQACENAGVWIPDPQGGEIFVMAMVFSYRWSRSFSNQMYCCCFNMDKTLYEL